MLLLLAFSLIAVHVAMPSPGVQVTVAARELPTGSLTQNESLCEEVIDRLNAMSDLRHASIIQMFGIVSPTTTPTLVSLTMLAPSVLSRFTALRFIFMAAVCNRAGHYIFALWFLSFFLFFFPRLTLVAADWMSTILPHMVWP